MPKNPLTDDELLMRNASWYRVTLKYFKYLPGDRKITETQDVLSDSRANAIRCVLDTSEHAGNVTNITVKLLCIATNDEKRNFFETIGE